MNNLELEKLLASYSQGYLSISEYREQRRAMVHQFIALKSRDDTLPKPQPANNIQTENKPFTIPSINKSSHSQQAQFLKIVGFTSLLVLASLSLFFGNPSNDTSRPVDGQVSIQEKQPNSVVTPPFIEEFMRLDKWDSEALSDFLVSWQKLSMEQQAQARQSSGFSKLTSRLKQLQVETKQAKMKGLKTAAREEKLLNWFAMRMAIEQE